MKKRSVAAWCRIVLFLAMLSLACFCGDFLYTGEETVRAVEGVPSLRKGETFGQRFVPEHGYLGDIVLWVEEKPETVPGRLVFGLWEEGAAAPLCEQEVDLSAVTAGWHLEFHVGKRLNRDRAYVIQMSFLESREAEGQAVSPENLIRLGEEILYRYHVMVPLRLVLFLVLAGGVLLGAVLSAVLPRGGKGGRELLMGELLSVPFPGTECPLIHVGMFVVVTVAAVLLRMAFWPVKSNDYYLCYEDWITAIRGYGGIESLGHVIGNYSPLFMILLGLLSYLPLEPVVIIKLTPCLFDFFLAVLSLRLLDVLRAEMGERGDVGSPGEKGIMGKAALYAFMLLNPVTLLNSSAWGQCDVVYTVFLLGAVYGLARRDSGKWYATGEGVCILFGTAFCLKQQALFFVPVLGLVWITQKRGVLKLAHLLWVPILYVGSCLPAYLMGRSFKQMFKIYLEQSAGDYGGLSINYPNLYSFVGTRDSSMRDSFFLLGLVLAFMALLFLYYWIYGSGRELGPLLLCKVTAATVLILCFCLPSIHERYAYLGEMLLGILMAVDGRYLKIAAVTFLCTTVTYCTYLYEVEYAFTAMPSWLTAAARLLCIAWVVRDILGGIRSGEGTGERTRRLTARQGADKEAEE